MACIGKIRDPEKKKRYEAATDFIDNAASRFETAARQLRMDVLIPEEFRPEDAGLEVPLRITSDDLSVKLYKQRMSHKDSPGRVIYDRIRLAAPHGICPLCSVRQVKTLDHYLPRSVYSALSVTPLNLIPACLDCNTVKLDVHPKSEGEQTLHPYFDRVTDVRWLRCEVVEGAPAGVRFFVDEPPEWTASMTQRVRRHFSVFQLAELYAHHAVPEMSSNRSTLQMMKKVKRGEELIRSHLAEQARSALVADLNSWQGALYEALSSSEWYCSGGFESLAN
ncbi:MAG: hypothetical protein LBU78_05405 [Microbacterium sp.]|nr:hypothetical protein [Microbacterium sp.]